MAPVGGDRVKQETVSNHQVWMRKKSGTHFVVEYIGIPILGEPPTDIHTFTIETRKSQRIQLHTLLHKGKYVCVANLVWCEVCHGLPVVRYGEFEGEPRYRVGCDCLEFDSEELLVEDAITGWKHRMKTLDAAARCRPGKRRTVIIPKDVK